MQTKDIFILSLFQHGNKVRGTTLSHLLRGKRTTSILIYGHFNQLLPYFSLFPKLSDEFVLNSLEVLLKEQYLTKSEPENYQLTMLGKAFLQHAEKPAVMDLNSFLYSRIDETFYELLLFATQVISEYGHQNRDYQPIETNPVKQTQLKNWLVALPNKRADLGNDFWQEWLTLLNQLPSNQAQEIVPLLSGYQQVGLTYGQLTDILELEALPAYLIRKNIIHFGLTEIRKNPAGYPLMFSLYQTIKQPLVNQSAQVTYHLFQQGWDLEGIKKRRQLKMSTISDHLIEWAIMDANFLHERVLSREEHDFLVNYQQKNKDYRNWRFGELSVQRPALSFLAFRCYQILQVRGEND